MKTVLLAVTLTVVASPAPTQPPAAAQPLASATLLEDRAEAETNAGQYAAAIRDANDAAAMHAAKGDARVGARAAYG